MSTPDHVVERQSLRRKRLLSQPGSCYLCNSDNTFDFIDCPPTPTMDGVMCATLAESRSIPKGEINLRLCKDCGYIGNEAYEESKVKFDNYDFSNDHSALFTTYVHSLCRRLVSKYQLTGKTILDVGCGDGYFLEHICALTGNRGIGIDSGFDHSRRNFGGDTDVSYIQDYYTDEYKNLSVDLVTCRLVIDLLPDPAAFLRVFRFNLDKQPETVVFFEVPNASYTFEEQVIWNVVYEHRSWFTADSLKYLFELCDFEVLDVVPLWNNEYLGIEARINQSADSNKRPSKAGLLQLENTIDRFRNSYQQLITDSEKKIAQLRSTGTRVIGWGAGARSVAFLNLFDIIDLMPYIVDVNVKRQGKYVPGSGQKIVSPAFIREYQPDLVIITNPTYADEIKRAIGQLGINPDIWVL